MADFLRILSRSQFLRSVGVLASGTALAQLITVLAAPLLTRLYSPSDFGVLAVFTACLGMLTVIASLRYELAIPIADSTRKAVALLWLCLALNVFLALVVAASVQLWGEALAYRAGMLDVAPYFWVLPVAVLGVGWYSTLRYWAVRHQAYGLIAKTRFAQAGTSVGAQIGAGLFGAGVSGLILGQVLGQVVGVSALARFAARDGIRPERRTGPDGPVAQAREHRRFPLLDAPAATITMLAWELPTFLLAALFQPATAGFYFLANKVVSVPLRVVGHAVGQVIHGRARDVINAGKLRSLTFKLTALLSAVIVVPCGVVFFWGDTLFVMVFGEAWRTAGEYAGWIIIATAIQFVYSPLSLILLATQAQHINLLIQTALLAMRLLAAGLGYWYDSALMMVIGLSVAAMVAYGGGLVVVIRRASAYATSDAARGLKN